MKLTQAYKLVREVPGNLDLFMSITGRFPLQGYDLTYEIGRTTYPKIGKCFVFGNLGDVKEFSLGFLGCQIFLAEVDSLEPILHVSSYVSDESIERFWWQQDYKKTCLAPRGSYVSNWVKLLKAV